MKTKNSESLRVFLAMAIFIFFASFASAAPNGGNVTVISSEKMTPDAPSSVQAQAGNVTQVNLNGYSVTRTWQGYYGNVTGKITLEDSEGNHFYNWEAINPRGQIYASINDSIQWQYTQCFNYTAAGTFADDTSNAGGTSQFGMNITQLHEMYNVDSDATDSVSSTFNLLGAGGHSSFYTGNLEFNEGECPSTELFDENGQQSGLFQETLLYEPETASVIFASILEQNEQGFDGNLYDFQMIVLEDGHGTDTETATYYLYVELE